MRENQGIEFKESWNDEYLAWVCGMANANGGKIFIGVRDDGEIIGVDNSKKLLIDIPNKIRSVLGIIVDVNLMFKEDKEYIEIIVYKSKKIIKYKGEYYYRSGATNQNLKEESLKDFLNSRYKQSFDSEILDNITIDDFDNESFDLFKNIVLKNKKLKKEDLKINNLNILYNLNLVNKDNYSRAAVLLFHKEPTKWFKYVYVKVEKYNNNELLETKDIKGSLILIYNQLIHMIKDKNEYPFEIFKELIINALLHNDYSSSSPIKIKYYIDSLIIENNVYINNEINVLEKKISYINNKLIASTFHVMGLINGWGTGVKRIIKKCKKDKKYTCSFNVKNNLFIAQLIKNINEEVDYLENDNDVKISGIDKYLEINNYNLTSLNFQNKKRLYILIENLILKKSLSFNEIMTILKINETICKVFLKEIEDLKIIVLNENEKYVLIINHYFRN